MAVSNFVSLDCALIVTRYVNQLRYEKKDARKSRIQDRRRAYDAFHRRFASGDDKHELVNREFDPYDSERGSPTLAGSIRSPMYGYEGKMSGDSYRYSYLSDTEGRASTASLPLSSAKGKGMDYFPVPEGAQRPATPSLHSPAR
jgi:hypothetical protein